MLYATKQRVRVPGQQAEAVIMDVTETVPGFPVYTIKYLSDAGENECGTIGEGDLHSANMTDAEIVRADQDAHDEVFRAKALIETEVAARVKHHLTGLANAKRKASRAKSAKPKRKR